MPSCVQGLKVVYDTVLKALMHRHTLSEDSITFRFVCFSDFYNQLQVQLEGVSKIQTVPYPCLYTYRLLGIDVNIDSPP